MANKWKHVMGKRDLTGCETCLDFKTYVILLGKYNVLQLFSPRKCTKVSTNIANNNEFVHAKLTNLQYVRTLLRPVSHVEFRPRLHYTGLNRSVAIFIPDSAAVYTTPQ